MPTNDPTGPTDVATRIDAPLAQMTLAEHDLAHHIDAANRAAAQPPAPDRPDPKSIRQRQVTVG